jgi:hypothetical protein
MLATLSISLPPLVWDVVLFWQTNDNPDFWRHLIFTKSYFGQVCNLTNMSNIQLRIYPNFIGVKTWQAQLIAPHDNFLKN